MPLQNRVTPEGEIIATAARGTMMGNRGGRLHRADRTLGARRWASRKWICCRLDFKGRRRAVMAQGLYTELFFLDEATALAAGHRPCFECRRAEAEHFARLWRLAHPGRSAGPGDRAGAASMDRALHAERLAAGGAKRVWRARLGDLPDGAIVRDALGGGPRLVCEGRLLLWTAQGYRDPVRLEASGHAEVLTPPGIIAVLKSGYAAFLHETARDLG